jgi:hypothetical protein
VWILDSRASNHRDLFSSLDDCLIQQIFVGDSSPIDVVGARTTDLTNGKISNVFFVPSFIAKLLSIFQIIHSCHGKNAKFSPHNVVIRYLKY